MSFRFYLPFEMEVPIGSIYPSVSIYPSGWKVPVGSIYPSGWKVTIGSIYPSRWKCPLGSIYHSGWKYPTGPFTLRDGSICWVRFYLPFRMEMPFNFHLPFEKEMPFGEQGIIGGFIRLPSLRYKKKEFSTLQDGSSSRVYLLFKKKIPFKFHLPFGMEVPDILVGSIYLFEFYLPFKMEMPFGFHLPFEMEVLVGSIYPSGSVYPSGSIYPSG